MTDLTDIIRLASDETTGDPRKDLDTFLQALGKYVQESNKKGLGGNALQLFTALRKLKDGDHSADDAAAVLDGFNIGLYLAAYNRDEFADAVQRSRQEKGAETRRKKMVERDAEIVEAYRSRLQKYGCLETRRHLAAKYDVSVARINQILHASGFKLSRSD